MIRIRSCATLLIAGALFAGQAVAGGGSGTGKSTGTGDAPTTPPTMPAPMPGQTGQTGMDQPTQMGALNLDQYTMAGDGDIASVYRTINQGQIQVSELARTRASNPEVRRYAEMMITDHSSASKSLDDFVGRAAVKVNDDNELSRRLKSDGDTTMQNLRQLRGADFDRLYIDNQITAHQQALDTFDRLLVPNASNAELRTLITNVRPTFQTHLDQAKKVRAQLKTGPT